jgi:hypothetical protein
MENMFWGGEVLKLESVALQENRINEWRDTLRKTIQASLIPLKAYAQGMFDSSSSNNRVRFDLCVIFSSIYIAYNADKCQHR